MAASKRSRIDRHLQRVQSGTAYRIASDTGMEVKDVQQALKELMEEGMVRVDKSGREWVWTHTSPKVKKEPSRQKREVHPKPFTKAIRVSRQERLYEALQRLTHAHPERTGFYQDEIAEACGLHTVPRRSIGEMLNHLAKRGLMGYSYSGRRPVWSFNLPVSTVRQRVYLFLQQKGPSSRSEVGDGIHEAMNLVDYHLKRLTEEGYISRKAGRYEVMAKLKPSRHGNIERRTIEQGGVEKRKYLSLLDATPKTVRQVAEAYHDRYGVFRSRTTMLDRLRELEVLGLARGSASRKGVPSVWVRVPVCKGPLQTEAGNP